MVWLVDSILMCIFLFSGLDCDGESSVLTEAGDMSLSSGVLWATPSGATSWSALVTNCPVSVALDSDESVLFLHRVSTLNRAI